MEDRDLRPALAALQAERRFPSFCNHIQSEAVRCMGNTRESSAAGLRGSPADFLMQKKRDASEAGLDWGNASSGRASKRCTL